MSTLKVDAIRHNSATSDAITTDADGTCTAKLTSVGGGGLSHRNKVINGSMIINQRSSSYTATGEEYLLDRFNHRTGSGFTFDTTTTQDTSAPDGFTKSLKITPDSTQTPSGSHNGMIGHLIEADNLLGFASGTSSAKSFALSFYAKSSSQNNNHQYSVQISKVNSGGTYYYQNRSFVVTSSWQRFTVVFPADTSNNIATGNGEGLRILWHLSAGPDDIASAVTSWTSSNGNHAVTGQSNFMDNTSNEFYLTGVQLEVGDTATSFEHRSFGDELARCQRYCVQYNSNNANRDYIMPAKVSDADDAYAAWQPPVATRTTYPTISVSNASHLALEYGDFSYSSPINFSSRDNTAANPYSPINFLNFDLNENVLSSGQMVYLAFANNTTGGYLRFEWEL